VTVAEVAATFGGSMTKFIAVAVRGTDCGALEALSARTMVAARGPTAAGVKVTLIRQVAAGATGAVHVFFWVKSPAFAPENEMEPMTRAPVPAFVMVRAAAALAVPTNWFAKLTVEGERETAA
jgi:hypothetical protein